MQVITSTHCFLPLKSFHTKRIYRHADCIKVIFPSTLEIIEVNNLQLSVEVEQSIVICQWQADHLFVEAENTYLDDTTHEQTMKKKRLVSVIQPLYFLQRYPVIT